MRAGLILLAALTLQACGAPAAPPAEDPNALPASRDPTPQATHDPAPPGAIPGGDQRVWNFGSEGGRTGLIYGTPESDDVALRLDCADGSGKIGIGAPVNQEGRKLGDRWDATLVLSSGGQTRSYPAQAQSNEMNGWAEASTTLPDPVLTAFASSGRITLGGSAHNADTAEEQALIRRFMDACRAE